MSSQYKENSFSTENLSSFSSINQNKISTAAKPNISHLMKRINTERKREKNKIIILIAFSLSLFLIFYFLQNQI